MLRRVLAVAALGLIVPLAAAVPSNAQTINRCAEENGYCRVPYPTVVYYGIPGTTSTRQVNGGGIPCSNRVFGDPHPGRPKFCYFLTESHPRRERDYDRGYERRRRDY